jgi:hypothetical protein
LEEFCLTDEAVEDGLGAVLLTDREEAEFPAGKVTSGEALHEAMNTNAPMRGKIFVRVIVTS